MPILIGVSPCAKLRMGGENSVDALSVAPVLMIVRRSNGVVRKLFMDRLPLALLHARSKKRKKREASRGHRTSRDVRQHAASPGAHIIECWRSRATWDVASHLRH